MRIDVELRCVAYRSFIGNNRLWRYYWLGKLRIRYIVLSPLFTCISLPPTLYNSLLSIRSGSNNFKIGQWLRLRGSPNLTRAGKNLLILVIAFANAFISSLSAQLFVSRQNDSGENIYTVFSTGGRRRHGNVRIRKILVRREICVLEIFFPRDKSRNFFLSLFLSPTNNCFF